jgi:hypothetical protein
VPWQGGGHRSLSRRSRRETALSRRGAVLTDVTRCRCCAYRRVHTGIVGVDGPTASAAKESPYPHGWKLLRRAGGDRGIVCGVLQRCPIPGRFRRMRKNFRRSTVLLHSFSSTRKSLMRLSLLIPAALLALAGCVSVTPAPRPQETTIVVPPTTTYVAPASTTDTTTTTRRTY